MRTKDFIYHHLFGMKAKTLAGMERNYIGTVDKGKERKQIETNKHKFKTQIKKEKNAQEEKNNC